MGEDSTNQPVTSSSSIFSGLFNSIGSALGDAARGYIWQNYGYAGDGTNVYLKDPNGNPYQVGQPSGNVAVPTTPASSASSMMPYIVLGVGALVVVMLVAR